MKQSDSGEYLNSDSTPATISPQYLPPADKSYKPGDAGHAIRWSLATLGWWLLWAFLLIGGIVGTIVSFALRIFLWGDTGVESAGTSLGSIKIDTGLLALATIVSGALTAATGVIYWRHRRVSIPAPAQGTIAWSKPIGGKLAKTIGLGVLLAFACLAVMQIGAVSLKAIGINVQSSDAGMSVESIVKWAVSSSGVSWLWVLLLVLVIGIAGPIAEEFVFRGLIGKTIIDSNVLRGVDGRRSWWQALLAYLLSGLFFGLVHVTGLTASSLITIILMTVFGALLTWLATRGKSLAGSIACHVTFNTMQILLVLVMAI